MKDFLLLLLLWIYTFRGISQGVTVEFYPEKDNSIFSENLSNSNGAGLYLFSGKTLQEGNRRAFVKFNISSIPADAHIESVSLRIPVLRAPNNSTAPQSFGIHKVLQNWGEGNSLSLGTGTQADGDDVTWQYSLFSSSIPWTVPGGTFVPTASAITVVSFSSFPVNFGVWTGETLKNDIMSWLDSPSSNFGWIIIGDESNIGSARGFGSREQISAYRPKLTIVYIPPIEDKILINEVNPSKKWVELYNPSEYPINIANYWLVNGVSSAKISEGGTTLLNGDFLLLPNKYSVVEWIGIGENNGELALFNKVPTDINAIMKDYIQYGIGNASNATKAVTAAVWDDRDAYVPLRTEENTYSLNPNGNYLSGKDTNSTSWLIQKQTPSYKNEICPSILNLTTSIIDATYQSIGRLTSTGSISTISKVKFQSTQAIILKNSFIIDKGAVFEAKIGACSN